MKPSYRLSSKAASTHVDERLLHRFAVLKNLSRTVIAPDNQSEPQETSPPTRQRQCVHLCRKLDLPVEVLLNADQESFEAIVDERCRGLGRKHRSAFDLLSRLADPGLRPAIYDADTGGLLEKVPAERPVRVGMGLPLRYQGSQALVFERDAAGVVSLVSLHGLVAGDVRHDCEISVPRILNHKDGPAPCGTLWFNDRGHSEFLVVACRSNRLRLDQLACFTRSSPTAPSYPLPEEGIPDTELRDLLGALLRLDRKDWVIARARIDII